MHIIFIFIYLINVQSAAIEKRMPVSLDFAEYLLVLLLDRV
jgi:hypothetical protein